MLWEIVRQGALLSFAGAGMMLLLPEGAGRQVLALALGAAVAVCLLAPLDGIDAGEIRRALQTYFAAQTAAEQEEEISVQKEILHGQIVAYIENRAWEHGISCTAEAELRHTEEGFRVTEIILHAGEAETAERRRALQKELGLGEEIIRCRQS